MHVHRLWIIIVKEPFVSVISSFYIHQRTFFFLKRAYATNCNRLSFLIPMSHKALSIPVELRPMITVTHGFVYPAVLWSRVRWATVPARCFMDGILEASGHICSTLKAISHHVIGHSNTGTFYDTASMNCLLSEHWKHNDAKNIDTIYIFLNYLWPQVKPFKM